MVRHVRKLIHIAPTLAFMLIGEDAMAGLSNNGSIGTIVYEPVMQSIPALSGSMLVVLGFLFAVLAFRALRAHSASKPLASIVAVGILILGAASGNQLMQSAQAESCPLFCFSNPSGGVLNVTVPGESPVLNNSGQLQRVISVTPSQNFSIGSTQSPQCTAGLTVQNNSFCYINFFIPIC